MAVYTDFGNSAVRAGLGASKRMKRNRKYTYIDFVANPSTFQLATGAAGTFGDTDAGVLNVDGVNCAVRIEQKIAAGVSASHSNATTNPGWTITDLDADGEGFQITPGPVSARGRQAFRVGTDDDFFSRLSFRVDDVSEADTLFFGWVDVAAGLIDTAIPTAHDDFFGLNVDAGDVEIMYDEANGGPTTTDTTEDVGDDDVVTMEIRVNSAGVCRAYLEVDTDSAVFEATATYGDVPSSLSAPSTDFTTFDFTDGDVVIPVLYVVTTGTSEPLVSLLEWETGYLRDRGLEDANDFTEDDYSQYTT